MTIVIEGKHSIFLSSNASLIEEGRDVAWAEKYVVQNQFHKWVLGKFVEANRANLNRQYWQLDHLQMARPTISHAPMNMLHHAHQIVGAFVATDMIYPTNDQAGDQNPFIEALGVFWKYYFPDEMKEVQEAHDSGQLFYSMECIAKSITCAGDQGCEKEFAYAGPASATYCDHLNDGMGIKQLNNPHFVGGALIIPPHKPGWKNAQITDLSYLTKQYQDECEKAYEGVKTEAPHLNSEQWENIMGMIVAWSEKDQVK